MNDKIYIHDQMYWLVGGKKTHSKGQALIWSNGDLSKVKFYFNDIEWKNKDYSKCPDKTFEQLALEQCRYFREHSDCLSLWLSGGFDSSTVLHYFSRAMVPLDEIIIYRRDIIEDNEYIQALKNAEQYKNKINPAVKIVFSELIGAAAHKYYRDYYSKMKHNFVTEPGLSVRFSKNAASYQMENNENLMKSIKLKNKRIDLLGFEKPRIYLFDDKWFVYLPDNLNYDFTGEKYFAGFYIANFDFFLKQVHMIIEWMESLDNLSEQLVNDIHSNKIFYKEWNLSCGRVPIYDTWGIDGKHKKVVQMNTVSPDSINQMKNFQDSKILINYHEGIEYLKQHCKWWDGKKDLYELATILSEARFVKKFNKKNK